MRVLYVASELYPFVKTGGLADVAAALPSALRRHDIDIRILLPGYAPARVRAEDFENADLREIARFDDMFGCGETRLLQTTLPGSDVAVWFIDCPQCYGRDGGPYQDGDGRDWPDNARRFALLSHMALAVVDGAVNSWRPELVHVNDWHAGLLPLLLSQRAEPGTPTLLTIHNLAYQGSFGADAFAGLGIPDRAFGDLEFYGRISFLKAGIRGASALTTVSPTYAREILTPEYGCGMDGLLRERADVLTGILNGTDYGIWNPQHDPHLAEVFSASAPGPKTACKRALQNELGLAADEDAPLMIFMSRMVHQKMPDTVIDALPALVEHGIQFAALACGEREYEQAFVNLAQRYPGKIAAHIGYEEPLAHRLLAGADMLAHPARFEPCGLVPIYAQRYGTIPLVRKSGGMADSVVDTTLETIHRGTATGFSFDNASTKDFLSCAQRAIAFYRQPSVWRKIQASAMTQDFGWDAAADAYQTLYARLTGQANERIESGVAKLSA